MIVVNLFGAPGAGKSTGATYVFSQLKLLGVNAEYVSEYAKDKVWGEDLLPLKCQEYVFGKQSMRLFKLKDKVDVAITDSPLILSSLYNNSEVLGKDFDKVVLNVFNSYFNINYFLNRVKPYNPVGRLQTAEESDILSNELLTKLTNNGIPFTFLDGTEDSYKRIVQEVLSKLNNNKIIN